jgi:hypothetical protein
MSATDEDGTFLPPETKEVLGQGRVLDQAQECEVKFVSPQVNNATQ